MNQFSEEIIKTLMLDKYQSYFDPDTGENLSLCFKSHSLFVDDIYVQLEKEPLLINEQNDNIYFPEKTKKIILCAIKETKKRNKDRVTIKPKQLEYKRYDYANKVGFLYSQIDYEYIPGLITFNKDDGFLVPVFFKISVLNKYSQNPDYKLNLFSETYGDISYKQDWLIPFGINKNKKVIMWLGDIDSLPENEQYYLRSENIDSDHDIHSEFYDAQINVQPSQPSQQTKAFRLRNELNKKISSCFNFDLYILEGEVSEIIKNLERPVFWKEKHIKPVVESLNKIFVESFNNKAIKQDIKSICAENPIKNLDKLGSNKTFQLWLEYRLQINNADDLMCPFFVLYDFRIATNHLQSSLSKKEIMENINKRLNLNETNNNYELIYDSLIEMLVSSYFKIIEELCYYIKN